MRSLSSRLLPANLLLAVSALAAPLLAQSSHSETLRVTPSVGYLAYGSYFSGPGDLQFSNQNGVGYGAELAVRISRSLEAIGNALHASSDWSFEGVPVFGSVSIGGASLWFYDAGLRARFPLGATGDIAPLVQLTAGAIHYSVENGLLSEQATNFTYSAGLGIMARLGNRLSVQGLLKDYVASFTSVDQAAALGIEGQRAHTLAALVGVGIGL